MFFGGMVDGIDEEKKTLIEIKTTNIKTKDTGIIEYLLNIGIKHNYIVNWQNSIISYLEFVL